MEIHDIKDKNITLTPFLLKGRPKFTRLDMSAVSIMRGVVLFAYGLENANILKHCSLNGYYVFLNNCITI